MHMQTEDFSGVSAPIIVRPMNEHLLSFHTGQTHRKGELKRIKVLALTGVPGDSGWGTEPKILIMRLRGQARPIYDGY